MWKRRSTLPIDYMWTVANFKLLANDEALVAILGKPQQAKDCLKSVAGIHNFGRIHPRCPMMDGLAWDPAKRCIHRIFRHVDDRSLPASFGCGKEPNLHLELFARVQFSVPPCLCVDKFAFRFVGRSITAAQNPGRLSIHTTVPPNICAMASGGRSR